MQKLFQIVPMVDAADSAPSLDHAGFTPSCAAGFAEKAPLLFIVCRAYLPNSRKRNFFVHDFLTAAAESLSAKIPLSTVNFMFLIFKKIIFCSDMHHIY